MTVDRLTAEEVAERAGTTSEHIALLAKVGILEPEDDGTYPRRDVLRARFVLGLDAMGIDANAVADALDSGDLTLRYVEIGGRRPPRSDRTFCSAMSRKLTRGGRACGPSGRSTLALECIRPRESDV
jgi:hypothetical protein